MKTVIVGYIGLGFSGFRVPLLNSCFLSKKVMSEPHSMGCLPSGDKVAAQNPKPEIVVSIVFSIVPT